jgi:hypothetical protein
MQLDLSRHDRRRSETAELRLVSRSRQRAVRVMPGHWHRHRGRRRRRRRVHRLRSGGGSPGHSPPARLGRTGPGSQDPGRSDPAPAAAFGDYLARRAAEPSYTGSTFLSAKKSIQLHLPACLISWDRCPAASAHRALRTARARSMLHVGCTTVGRVLSSAAVGHPEGTRSARDRSGRPPTIHGRGLGRNCAPQAR